MIKIGTFLDQTVFFLAKQNIMSIYNHGHQTVHIILNVILFIPIWATWTINDNWYLLNGTLQICLSMQIFLSVRTDQIS